MRFLKIARLTIALVALTRIAAAQAPVRTTDIDRRDPARTVTLPLAEYNRLIDLANRPPQTPPVAPLGAVLASADLRVRVERETVRGVFSLAGDVLRPGVQPVALVSGATLIDGTAAGRPLALSSDGTVHTALVPGPGPFALTLEWGAPLVFTPGRASFVLPVPSAGTAHATIDLPGDQADVHLSDGLVTARSTANGRTTVDVTLRPGASIQVWWSMRDSAPVAAARELRMLADVFTLITLDDSTVRLVALVDLNVVQGEARTIDLRLPAGYEVTSISGSSIESSEPRDGGVVLTIADPALRRHQLLVSLERPHDGGSFALQTGFPSVPGAQRERGEVAVEGVGTLELTTSGVAEDEPAPAATAVHRVDVRELNPALHSLARLPLLAAFRYQRGAAATPSALTLNVKRFPDAGVLAAVADRAVATTLITTEGRALTEVALQVRNRAQPFMKVTLPPGATIVSVEIAGQPSKPVVGVDGTRVPLLRPGLPNTGAYPVSFVYVHAGTPFVRKGEFRMTLPKMDVPAGIVEWEVFVPEQYSVHAVDGNVIDRSLFATAIDSETGLESLDAAAGAVGGAAGGIRESVTVVAESPQVERSKDAKGVQAPSQNVINLQRRTAGVLPVRVDVPRAGISHQFVRPLVVDRETVVTLKYKRR